MSPERIAFAIGIAAGLAYGLSGCPLPAESQHRIATCSARYAACVEMSAKMDEYRYCRGVVDAECLDDAGAP